MSKVNFVLEIQDEQPGQLVGPFEWNEAVDLATKIAKELKDDGDGPIPLNEEEELALLADGYFKYDGQAVHVLEATDSWSE